MVEATPIITSFNGLDVGIVVLTGLSTLAGVMRGLTREVLSLGAWGGATSVTFFCFPFFKKYTRGLIGQPFISDAITIIGLFLTFLIGFSLTIRAISNAVKVSILGGIDRSLGLLFGAFRACLVCIGLFLISGMLWKTPEERPLLLKTSRLIPIIAKGSKFAARFIPAEYLSADKLKDLTRQLEHNPHDLMFKLANPTPTDINSGKDKVSSYGNDQRKDMNRLFQNHAD